MITKQGIVVAISGQKTVKVEVADYRTHPKYKKRYRVTRNFLVHDESGKVKVGDHVSILPCRPLSKKKSWKLEKVLAHTRNVEELE